MIRNFYHDRTYDHLYEVLANETTHEVLRIHA